jgi:SAM-dependent methyltransferase
MPPEAPHFEDYLTRHYAHLGDHARYREGRKRALRQTYEHLLPADRGAAILEIGPGFAQLLELLRRDMGYGNAVAVDLSAEVVRFCNERLPGSTMLAEDTVEFLAARRAGYTRIFALHVLEHVRREDVGALVSAIHDALAPGGQFVLELPNMGNVFTGNYLRYADPTHEHGYTEWSVRHLLESAGFVDVRCFEDSVAPGGAKHAAAALFRAVARLAQRTIYRGYELPVPQVLTPALCAVGTRRADSR